MAFTPTANATASASQVSSFPDELVTVSLHSHAQLRPAQLRPAQLSPAQLSPAQVSPAQVSSAMLNPAQSFTAQLGSA